MAGIMQGGLLGGATNYAAHAIFSVGGLIDDAAQFSRGHIGEAWSGVRVVFRKLWVVFDQQGGILGI